MSEPTASLKTELRKAFVKLVTTSAQFNASINRSSWADWRGSTSRPSTTTSPSRTSSRSSSRRSRA